MELSLLRITPSISLLNSTTIACKKRKAVSSSCHCSNSVNVDNEKVGLVSDVSGYDADGRRWFMGCLLATVSGLAMSNKAEAVSTSRRALRAAKIPESEFKTLPSGLKYYDIKVGGGPTAVKGSRVAVCVAFLILMAVRFIAFAI